MRTHILTAIACLAVLAPAGALTTEEVVQLHRAGVSDRIIVESIRTDGSRFELTPAEVRRLRGEGVSDEVLAAMEEVSRPRDAVRAQSVAEAPVSEAPSAGRPGYSPLDRDSRRGTGTEAARRTRATAGHGALPRSGGAPVAVTLANDDERVKSFVWDAGSRLLRFFPHSPAGAQALARGASTALEIEPGVIAVNWNGEWGHYRIALRPGSRTELRSWSGVANGSPAIRLTVLRDGGLYGATNLKVFYDRPVPLPRTGPG